MAFRESTAPAAATTYHPRALTDRFGWGLVHGLLLLVGLFMVFPFAWTIGTSLKTPGEIFTWPPALYPAEPQPINYVDLFRTVPFFNWLRNSVVVTVAATIGAVLSSTLTGYAFARLRYPGRDLFFTVCLSTMMLPSIVTLIPSFILYRYLGWIDTFLPLIVPSWLGTPFYIFLSRQHFRTIPREYEEAARVDGASSWRIWWTLMLPMSRTLLGAIVIFSFIAHWNEFLGPLIYLNSVENQTLALGLRGLQNFYNTRWDFIMAGAVLMTLPMIAVFFLAQRFFIEGMSAFSGLAGR
ncbi:MAG TPA: carbohydrate ABC transporter permease [Chloroflexota bacterium]|jgi:ABC-type glycerol-3-phosphate transport system permease component|nr:carbohydrate ABC transporter permease [Chloroflexota bacterium]